MWDDTLLIFTADNGACRQTATSQRLNRNRDQPRRVLLLLLLLRGDDGDDNFSSRAVDDNQQRLPPPDAPTRSLCPQPTVVWLRRVS